jgi:hypothetical protein
MRRLLLAALVVGCMGLSTPVPAQDLETSIVGVWKLSSFTRSAPELGKVIDVFGERPTGYLIYTKGGRIMAFLVGSDRKVPERVEPTDAERADLFKSMIGYTGTYWVEGTKIHVRADASWIQSWTGVDRTQNAEVTGDRLTITAVVKSPRDGSEVFVKNVWERVE